MAIAQRVESTIFRDLEIQRGQVDVDVAEGIVRLRGEVRTPDLINELEARAARVPQVRRVENLLRTPAPPPEPATQHVDPPSTLGKTSAPPAPALRTRNLAAAAQETGAAPGEEPALGRREGNESADHDEAGLADADKGPSYQRKDPGPHGLKRG